MAFFFVFIKVESNNSLFPVDRQTIQYFIKPWIIYLSGFRLDVADLQFLSNCSVADKDCHFLSCVPGKIKKNIPTLLIDKHWWLVLSRNFFYVSVQSSFFPLISVYVYAGNSITDDRHIRPDRHCSIVRQCDVHCCTLHTYIYFFPFLHLLYSFYATGEKRPSRERAKCRIPSILLTSLMTSKSFGGVTFQIEKITLWLHLLFTWQDSSSEKK